MISLKLWINKNLCRNSNMFLIYVDAGIIIDFVSINKKKIQDLMINQCPLHLTAKHNMNLEKKIVKLTYTLNAHMQSVWMQKRKRLEEHCLRNLQMQHIPKSMFFSSHSHTCTHTHTNTNICMRISREKVFFNIFFLKS